MPQSRLTTRSQVALAARTGALLLALEHRFYGASFPAADLSVPSLRLLSSRQALADLARFHSHATQRFGLLPATKWVTWGGSYPGMLAAWARLSYPHLFHAAVASSAPVGAVLNFRGYNDVVGDALANAAVGGDAACAAAVRRAFGALGDALQSADGRRALEAAFPVCPSDGYDDVPGPLEDTFAAASLSEDLSYLFPAQGNDPACAEPGCNIAAACAALRPANASAPDDGAAALARLAALVALALPPGECVGGGRAEAQRALADTSLDAGTGRVWLWQTCTEFGFYQTCDLDSRCPFTSAPHLNSLAASLDYCTMAFGDAITAGVPPAVAATNEGYGGLTPGSTRVLYVNGDIDPWSAASIASAPGADAPVLWVSGASHHAWTHPPRESDTAEVVAARRAIFAQVTAWLSDAQPPPSGDCKWSPAGTAVNAGLAVVNAVAAVVMGVLACRRCGSGSESGSDAGYGDAAADQNGDADGDAAAPLPLLGGGGALEDGLEAPLLA